MNKVDQVRWILKGTKKYICEGCLKTVTVPRNSQRYLYCNKCLGTSFKRDTSSLYRIELFTYE